MALRDELTRLIDDILDDDPRTALIAYRRLAADELPFLEQRVVSVARRNNWNWAKIARLLGTTRQNARQRFAKATIHLRVSRNPERARQDSAFYAVRNDLRRARDDDPIAW